MQMGVPSTFVDMNHDLLVGRDAGGGRSRSGWVTAGGGA
jgi:hypothetical protein